MSTAATHGWEIFIAACGVFLIGFGTWITISQTYVSRNEYLEAIKRIDGNISDIKTSSSVIEQYILGHQLQAHPSSYDEFVKEFNSRQRK